MSRTLSFARVLSAAVALIVGVVPGSTAAAQRNVKPSNVPQPGTQQGAPAGANPSAQPAATAASAKFRISINGFRVDAATRDHILDVDGIGDEMFVSATVIVVDSALGLATPASTVRTLVYGEQRRDIGRQIVWKDRAQAGTGGPAGGLRSGNMVPSQTPWQRVYTHGPQYLPLEVWCGTLTEGKNAAVIVPSIWEWDGVSSTFGEWVGWGSKVATELADNTAVATLIGSVASAGAATAVSAALLGAKLALGAAVSLDETGLVGGERDRPIGVRRSTKKPKTFEFTPEHKFVLNYRTATFSTTGAGAVGGFAPGVFPIEFADDPFYQGVYTLFVQIERMDGKQCAHEYVPPPKK